MLLIKKRCIGEAHEEVIRLIIEKSEGNIRITEDNEITYDPEDPICIHIDEPLSEPVRSSASLFGEGFSNQYQASLYTITPRRGDGTDAVYTYGNRLRDYPCPEMEYCSKDKRRFLGILDPPPQENLSGKEMGGMEE